MGVYSSLTNVCNVPTKANDLHPVLLFKAHPRDLNDFAVTAGCQDKTRLALFGAAPLMPVGLPQALFVL